MNRYEFAIPRAVIYFCLLLAGNSPAAHWPDVDSLPFRSALDYAFAYTLRSSVDVNCWSPLCGDAYRLTQSIHKARGTKVTVDVVGRKTDDGTLRVFVFFPGFQSRSETSALNFLKTNDGYLFLGQSFEPDFVRFDFRDPITISLPEDCRSVVRSEFQPKADDIARLLRWCRGLLNDYPQLKDKTNHFFMEVSSLRYVSTKSFYWVEGQKIVRAEPLFHPDKQGVRWRVVHDFSEKQFHQPPSNGNMDDYGGFLDRMNQEVSKHVVDGMLLTVVPNKSTR